MRNASLWLFLATIAAVFIANSPWSAWYETFLESPVFLQIGSFNIFSHHGEPMTLLSFVNDALMAVFFFVVGLEIKQEVLTGELSSVKKAVLPIVAAIGGMLVPVLFFLLVQSEMPGAKGVAIPMATDIAFALGILSVFGKRVPLSLKIFLTTLAVVDDIGGILVMAIFYSDHIAFMPLIFAFICLAILFVGGLKRINSKIFYYGIGFIVWILFLESGIHAAIAGVLIAFTIPAMPKMLFPELLKTLQRALKKLPKMVKATKKAVVLNQRQIHILKCVQVGAEKGISPLQSMLEDLENFVHYFVLPLFAFVNAGVTFGGIDATALMGVPLAIFVGLFLGKTLGIFMFSHFFIRFGWAGMPSGMNGKTLLAISVLGGVGFTVALFMANLAYSSIPDCGADLLNQAKIGVFSGSLISGLVAYFLLYKFLPKVK